jgi:hypothetical protein
MANVIEIGAGKVVSNWGTYNGFPALFIEPVLGEPGRSGDELEEGREPQIVKDSVSDEGTVLVFRGLRGAQVIIEDIQSAQSHQ